MLSILYTYVHRLYCPHIFRSDTVPIGFDVIVLLKEEHDFELNAPYFKFIESFLLV